MGKASRTKRERREVPPVTVRGKRSPQTNRAVWLTTAGIGVVIAIGVVVLAITRGNESPAPPPPATISSSDQNAPASLQRAADASGFHPTTEPGIGEIESKPASAAQPAYSTTLLSAGTTAPDFTLKSPEGKTYRLASYRGKPLLLEFFASWCPHCNAEAPHLAKLAKSLAGRAAFVSINADGEDPGSVFAFHRYYALPYPALLDPSDKQGSFVKPGDPGPVTSAYGVSSYPTFYVVDPKGKIAWGSDGEQPDAKLRQELVAASGT